MSAETSKTHLEEQVANLNRQLQGDEEKLAVYQRTAPATTVSPTDDNATQEQELQSEVAELRFVRCALRVMTVLKFVC